MEDILSLTTEIKMHFVLDPLQIPPILALAKKCKSILEHVFYLTRTFAYYMHRERMVLLDRWPGDPGRKQRVIVRTKHTKMLQMINTPPITNNYDCFVGPALTASSSCVAGTGSTTSLTASSIHTVDKASDNQPSLLCMSNSSNTPLTPLVIVTSTDPCTNSTLSVSIHTTPATWQHPRVAEFTPVQLDSLTLTDQPS